MALTRQDLALEMGVSRNTFAKLIKQHDIPLPRGVLSPEDRAVILYKTGYAHLLTPQEINTYVIKRIHYDS